MVLEYLEISLSEYLLKQKNSFESIKAVVRGIIDAVRSMHG